MNEISVNIHGLSAMCPLCLSKSITLLDIFHFSAKMRTQLENIIMRCAPVQIRRLEQMPNFICRLCYTQLEKIHQFEMQIIQSDKTLRRYLQQLHGSDKQIKTECSIQKSSEEHLIHKTDHCDITVKCEPTHDDSLNFTEYTDGTIDILSKGDYSEIVCEDTKVGISDTNLGENMDIIWNEKTLANFKSANKINQGKPLKFEMKEEPTNDNALNLSECADDTVDILSKGDYSEIVCEDTKVGISDTNLGENMDIIWKERRLANFKSANKINQGKPLKFEMKEEPTNDNALNLADYADGTVEILSKSDGSEIGFENTKIDSDQISGDNVGECLDKSEVEKKYIALNYETHKNATENKYHCDFCNKSFTKSCTLKIHILCIHRGEKPSECDKPYQCDVCNKYFRRSSNLTIHKRTHTGEKPYRCDLCNKCFTHSGNFISHKRTHTGEKPYRCDLCNKCFTQSTNLNDHKRLHTGEKSHKCDICNKCFTQSCHLNDHKRTHTGEKPYQCDVCNKFFSHSSTLNYHKRTHTGEKPYECDVCNKCFSRLDCLNFHKRTHTGEKPHQCAVCNKCFSQRSTLNYHKRTHTGEKPYQCAVCNKCFSQVSSLNYHKRTHTGEKL